MPDVEHDHLVSLSARVVQIGIRMQHGTASHGDWLERERIDRELRTQYLNGLLSAAPERRKAINEAMAEGAKLGSS